MKTFPIPYADQIDAMLNGTIYDLLTQYIEHPRGTDFRKFISVRRPELINFLNEHPSAAEAYFRKQLASSPTHDVEKIFHRDLQYVVASMDHGKERDVHCFGSLAEAVAQHVLVSHGMY